MMNAGQICLAPDYLLVPQVSNFNAWASLIHEWIGYASYKIRGYC